MGKCKHKISSLSTGFLPPQILQENMHRALCPPFSILRLPHLSPQTLHPAEASLCLQTSGAQDGHVSITSLTVTAVWYSNTMHYQLAHIHIQQQHVSTA